MTSPCALCDDHARVAVRMVSLAQAFGRILRPWEQRLPNASPATHRCAVQLSAFMSNAMPGASTVRTRSGCGFDREPGVLILELLRTDRSAWLQRSVRNIPLQNRGHPHTPRLEPSRRPGSFAWRDRSPEHKRRTCAPPSIAPRWRSLAPYDAGRRGHPPHQFTIVAP